MNTHLPMKMEPTVSSETSAIRTQTPGNYPKRNKLHLEHGESLKTRIKKILPQNIFSIIGTAHILYNRLPCPLVVLLPATVFVVYCVGSNSLKKVCSLTKLMKSQLATFGIFNEFCFNFLLLFVALKCIHIDM